jgi:hypothetical protein
MSNPISGRSHQSKGGSMDTYKLSSDSEWLEFLTNGEITIGFVQEVNGNEAVEVPEFVPTKHELKEIVKYWFHQTLQNDFFFFETGCSGSTEWRINIYAERRINRAAEILSEQELDELIADAERGFKKEYKIPDEVWNIFKNGSRQE